MNDRRIIALVCGLLVLFSATYGQNKQLAKDSSIHIESLMTAAEFKSCGLNKLTPEEIAHLGSWLSSFGKQAASVVGDRNSAGANVVESEIDGDFHGWDGNTIFKLVNGQIWQQTEYDYEYEYAY